jgi:hypothetical protein
MNQSVRVKSIESLREFRAALSRFAQVASAALMEAELDVQRTTSWLEHDQHSYWQGQIRQREERLKKAEAELRSKKTFLASSMSSQRSFDEEQKAVDAARRQLEQAQQKLKSVKHWIPQLQRESFSFKGLVRGLYQGLEVDIPNAMAQLGGMAEALEAYSAAAPLSPDEISAGMTQPPADQETMTRPVSESPQEVSPSVPPKKAGEEHDGDQTDYPEQPGGGQIKRSGP